MMSFEPLYKTLKEKGLTEYYLIFKQGISASTVYRFKHNQPVSTKTIETLCEILDCKVEDVIEYIKD